MPSVSKLNEVKQVQHDNMKTRRLTRREAKGEYPRVLEPGEIKGMNRKWRLKDAERYSTGLQTHGYLTPRLPDDLEPTTKHKQTMTQKEPPATTHKKGRHKSPPKKVRCTHTETRRQDRFCMRAMYFPMMSNSMFTTVPTLMCLKLVCSKV